MTSVALPTGYSARPPHVGDTKAVAEMIAACKRPNRGEADMTLEEKMHLYRKELRKGKDFSAALSEMA